MIAERIDTHVDDALNRLLQSLQGRPVMEGIITAIAQSVQAFENCAYTVNASRALFGGGAYGEQLDGIGQLVGIARGGLDDQTYRVLILGTIAESNSRADTSSLLEIAQTVFEASSAYIIQPMSPGHSIHRGAATLGLEVGSAQIDSSLYSLVIGIFQKSMAANVALSYVVTCDAQNAFAFDGDADGLGFDDLNNPGLGGMFGALQFNNLAA